MKRKHKTYPEDGGALNPSALNQYQDEASYSQANQQYDETDKTPLRIILYPAFFDIRPDTRFHLPDIRLEELFKLKQF